MAIHSFASNSGSKGGIKAPRQNKIESLASNSGTKGGNNAPRK